MRMPDLTKALVVGIASSALFDLSECDSVFREEGRAAYEKYQEDHLKDTLAPGTAYPFIHRLLALNSLRPGLVEVIVMSRNSPKSGLRVMESIRDHRLDITRSVFREGESSFQFMPTFNMSLFLSANREDVVAAVEAGHPAGHVLPSAARLDPDDDSLRLAFDFDGVLADDASERRFQEDGSLEQYCKYESAHANEPLTPGPLKNFLQAVNGIQELEDARLDSDPKYRKRVRVSLVTARNAPAHERSIRSLEAWGLHVDDAFFLGGLSKTGVLNALLPHMFFDDQLKNIKDPDLSTPSVHIPFGVHNLQPVRQVTGEEG
jgi:5'-nucleotidase